MNLSLELLNVIFSSVSWGDSPCPMLATALIKSVCKNDGNLCAYPFSVLNQLYIGLLFTKLVLSTDFLKRFHSQFAKTTSEPARTVGATFLISVSPG